MKREGDIPWPHRLPSTAVHSGHHPLPCKSPQSPEADLSLPRAEPPCPTQCHLLGCHRRDLLPCPAPARWRVSSWYCHGEKARCQCLLVSHPRERLPYRCIHHSHPHPTNSWGRAAGGSRNPPSKITLLKETMPGNELGERDETPIYSL